MPSSPVHTFSIRMDEHHLNPPRHTSYMRECISDVCLLTRPFIFESPLVRKYIHELRLPVKCGKSCGERSDVASLREVVHKDTNSTR